MNTSIAMGTFALVVALISLMRLMAAREFFRVRLLKRVFGRKVGLVLFFLTNIATPLVCGVVFLCSGISRHPAIPSLIVENPLPDHYQWTIPPGENAPAEDAHLLS